MKFERISVRAQKGDNGITRVKSDDFLHAKKR